MPRKSEQYRRHFHEFSVRAEQCTPEIAQLWREIANSYRFLMEREDRIELEDRGRISSSGS